ncbi:MAG: type II secretion system F family protein [Candidatus Micrarchaeota archaeon]
MSNLIPLSLLPPRVTLVLSRRLAWLGGFIAYYFPSLEEKLTQSEYDYSPREYCAIAVVVALSNAVFVSILMGLVAGALKLSLFIPVAIALVVSLASFFTVLAYPAITATRKARDLERNLIPAVRQILIQLRAGVSLFDAMMSVSDDYGSVSVEFEKIVKKINSGTPEVDALAEASKSIPSNQFQKVLWQISNAIKVGSDVSDALQAILEDLTREQINRIHKYGQELSPWTMMYMLGAVVVPSLGITMLIVITSFLNVVVPKLILPVILFVLIMFQVFFANFVGSRRPTT